MLFRSLDDFVCLQWLVGNVVQRDDTLYARMKQREIDAHDSMWEPIFVDDAAMGLGEQKNKVLVHTMETDHMQCGMFSF